LNKRQHLLARRAAAQVVNLKDCVSLNSLFEHSNNLLNDLSWERRQDVVSLACSLKDNHIQIYLAGLPDNLCGTLSWQTSVLFKAQSSVRSTHQMITLAGT
jgi:hypothetical protein